MVRWAGRQFCGLDSSGSQTEAEAEALEKVTSLRQNPLARLVQSVLLVVLVTFSAGLMIVLSIPDGPFSWGYEPFSQNLTDHSS